MLRELLRLIDPYVERLGTRKEIDHLYTIIERGTSADRQRRVYREHGGDANNKSALAPSWTRFTAEDDDLLKSVFRPRISRKKSEVTGSTSTTDVLREIRGRGQYFDLGCSPRYPRSGIELRSRMSSETSEIWEHAQ